ncbi:MAG: ABC transporter ATP-binding protein [Pseudomonadales bacterium]|nr:ABC transporter ATP-binding protein [Pseudomonadales bacterium]
MTNDLYDTQQPEEYDLECRNIHKSFGDFTAVRDVSFRIPKGSFFSILGPSGCGKTTLLRMLAGFQSPDQGDILIKGCSVLDTPPNRRPVNMVFQHLALFPNMTVAENIAYGLKRRKVPKTEIKDRVTDMLERVGLPDSGAKQIDQLSGGQKQRIAIARCLVLKPDVLLLDEPLGALDLKLREQMKVELKHLQEKFGTTFVYITHDQSEALVMSDQVAVMNAGEFEQVGTPQELYYHPATRFVAGFVGDSNHWRGVVTGRTANGYSIHFDSGLTLRTHHQQRAHHSKAHESWSIGEAVECFIRPEAISVVAGALETDYHFQGFVDSILFDGARSQLLVQLPGVSACLNVSLPQTAQFRTLTKGEPVTIGWNESQMQLFSQPDGQDGK